MIRMVLRFGSGKGLDSASAGRLMPAEWRIGKWYPSACAIAAYMAITGLVLVLLFKKRTAGKKLYWYR